MKILFVKSRLRSEIPDMAAKLALVTHHPFWFQNTGTRNRIFSFYKALKDDTRFDTDIAYLRYLNTNDRDTLSKFKGFDVTSVPSMAKKDKKYEKYPFQFLRENPALERSLNIPCWHGFQEYMDKKPDIVIFTYIEQLYLFPKAKDAITAIDTNDLNSMRASIFNFNKKPIPLNISLQDEMRILSMLDFVVAIQEDEFSIISANMPSSKASYVPHIPADVIVKPRGQAPTPLKVLYPASHQQPNIDGLNWFLNNVWPSLPPKAFELNICGSICSSAEFADGEAYNGFKNVKFIGMVEELGDIYNKSDIVINPCPYGSGLKIKSIEALSYGVPLVTTSVGAEGLRAGIGRAFLTADTPAEFVFAMYSMLEEKNREHFSQAGMAFVRDFFSEDLYFKHFMDQLHSLFKFRAAEAVQ